MAAPALPEIPVTSPDVMAKPRTRPRPQPIDLKKKGGDDPKVTVAKRVTTFLTQDDAARAGDIEDREQRYAKLMQFEDDATGWSNVQLPDIMASTLDLEDQIQNSVMSTRPIMNAHATSEVNKDRERKADLLLDYQFFVEQRGEALIEKLTADFFRDGQFVALTHWVREHRKIQYVRSFEPLPFGEDPAEFFKRCLIQAFGKAGYTPLDDDGWDWKVRDGEMVLTVRFFTEEEPRSTLMEVSGEPVVFEGPCTLRYRYEDVLAPLWSENLQPPGPSNPDGAPHVILVDYPTREEIISLIEHGFYDLVSEEDEKRIKAATGTKDWSNSDRELARQKHELRGFGPPPSDSGVDDKGQTQMKRIMCFDVWKGIDVVWWVLDPPGILLRARPLTEVSPGLRPVRPIAHAVCFPVQDTWIGMGVPELVESLHDFKTTTFNQMTDASELEIRPPFLYRQSSNLKPQDITCMPGEGIPVQNVQTDIAWQRITPVATQVGSNMIALANQMYMELMKRSELNTGQIPQGSSAALRTSSGIAQVLAQGEARPERILRRFFGGLAQVFETMYRLDRHFLTNRKKFRAVGVTRPDEDPIIEINRAEDLGETVFEFGANVLNSSKVALQQSLKELLGIYAQPLMMQLGITTPETIHRLTSDYAKSLGQSPEKYSNSPAPQIQGPPIYAADALDMILHGKQPKGLPAEGSYEAHIQGLLTALQKPGIDGRPASDAFSTEEREAIALYLQSVIQQAQQAQMQFAQMQAAAQFQAGQQQGGAGPGGPQPQGGVPMISGGKEQVNEKMPMGAGGPGK